jgi:hypothetical protein
MPIITEFTPAAVEKLQYYVYLLSDPRSKRVFYVGKGTGNRIFAHLRAAIVRPEQTDKLETIRGLQREGLDPEHLILRHGLTEKEAVEVEAAVLDYIGLGELTNAVHGHHADARGRMTISEAIARYDADDVTIRAPAILIAVNSFYRRGMAEEELYAITSGSGWCARAGCRRSNTRSASMTASYSRYTVSWAGTLRKRGVRNRSIKIVGNSTARLRVRCSTMWAAALRSTSQGARKT